MSEDKGFSFQERDASSPKNNTSVVFFSIETLLSFDNMFMNDDRMCETFQERDGSSPKNNTALFISGESYDAYGNPGQGKTDIYGNAISNQKKRGQI